MNFSVSSSGIASVNTYKGINNNTISKNFLNQEYDVGDDPNFYSNTDDESNKVLNFFSGLGNVLYVSECSPYIKNFVYIVGKDLVNILVEHVISNKVLGKVISATSVKALWIVGSVFAGEWQGVTNAFNDVALSSTLKTLFKENTKKDIENKVKSFSSQLYSKSLQKYNNKLQSSIDSLLKLADESGEYEEYSFLIKKGYEKIAENISRSGNIFDELKEDAINNVDSGKKIRSYFSNGSQNVGSYFTAAADATLKKVGSAVACDYVASLVVNIGKAGFNGKLEKALRGHYGDWGDYEYRITYILGDVLKAGSSLTKSSWKAICSTAGECIGFAIGGGPTGAKIGKTVGTAIGANIGEFVVELFDKNEAWCAAAGTAAVGGAVAGGAIATAYIVGAEISLAFPGGTIIGAAIIVGATIATGIVYVLYTATN